MMRAKPASSMQKTYDECYLICSTAVFFEGQNNEAEALRSWKSALDQIYYHNAYRIPSSYVPKTETERALFTSLKQLELQCKERVDLLEALKRSRQEAEKDEKPDPMKRRLERGKVSVDSLPDRSSGWLGDGTIPPVQYPDLPTTLPALPPRPFMKSSKSTETVNRKFSESRVPSSPLGPPPPLPVPANQSSRSPSPDPGRKTMRTTLRPDRKPNSFSRPVSQPQRRPAPMKAAGLAWDTNPRKGSQSSSKPEADPTIEARLSATAARRSLDQGMLRQIDREEEPVRMPDPSDYIPTAHWRDMSDSSQGPSILDQPLDNLRLDPTRAPPTSYMDDLLSFETPPPVPEHAPALNPIVAKTRQSSPPRLTKAPDLSYRREYPATKSKVPPALASQILDRAYQKEGADSAGSSGVSRKPLRKSGLPTTVPKTQRPRDNPTSESEEEPRAAQKEKPRRSRPERQESSKTITPSSTDAESPDDDNLQTAFDRRAEKLMKNLPKGVDENAAKQIMNEVVVKGDEVHWEDVAGLHGAKKALKEAVVYPFLRPDLFMGLREPARGMLLFGPPGTGKTMLARAVATESRSCFFAISASSLTSKWHGDSEKLVRALFGMAKALAPSIIFVDEIDSLLSARSGSSENEASRRSKTEFLIQWSDLQRAAAGKETTVGDATWVLVLAATNCPWDIDEAARRRFVRRQYIPLPEAETRETQIQTLLKSQRHDLSAHDIERLVALTAGYSGSDITALAKDAAMGPLRNLGEELLFTPMEKIRPIHMLDFQASLDSIRPSVSKKGLEEFEEWAREFGERGG